jgi:hypothetical protein
MAREDNIGAEGAREQFPQGSMQSKVGELKEDAKQQGRQHAETGKTMMADQAEKLAGAAERVSSELRREMPRVADYTDEIANSIRQFSERIRGRTIDELLADAHEFARRNPALFFIGSAAVGVALARFFKASSQRRETAGFTDDSSAWNPDQPIVEQSEHQSPRAAGTWPEGSGLS